MELIDFVRENPNVREAVFDAISRYPYLGDSARAAIRDLKDNGTDWGEDLAEAIRENNDSLIVYLDIASIREIVYSVAYGCSRKERYALVRYILYVEKLRKENSPTLTAWEDEMAAISKNLDLDVHLAFAVTDQLFGDTKEEMMRYIAFLAGTFGWAREAVIEALGGEDIFAYWRSTEWDRSSGLYLDLDTGKVSASPNAD